MKADRREQARCEDESRLVDLCQAGDEEAFEQLVTRFQNMVFNLAYRFMGEAQEAEDLSQEVFIKVYRNLASFRRDSSLKTWIYRITTNMALNRIKWLRRRRSHRQVSIDSAAGDDQRPLAELLPDGAPGPDGKVHGWQIHQRMQKSLDELGGDQKAVVILRDIIGMSYEEIALTLGINLGTVKSRLARGRAGLQHKLRDLL